MKIRLIDVCMCLFVSYECLYDYDYMQVCVLIYTELVPPTSIYTAHSMATNYTLVDVLVVHTQTLNYTHNILLLLTK